MQTINIKPTAPKITRFNSVLTRVQLAQRIFETSYGTTKVEFVKCLEYGNDKDGVLVYSLWETTTGEHKIWDEKKYPSLVNAKRQIVKMFVPDYSEDNKCYKYTA